MGAVDSPGPRGHDKKKGKKKKKRRVGVKIDNTPMVDVAFLLLTFFMLTTSMNKPQTMEINLPPSNEVTVEVAQSNLMTVRVKEDGSIYWNISTDTPEKVEFKGLRALMVRRGHRVLKATLATLVPKVLLVLLAIQVLLVLWVLQGLPGLMEKLAG